MRMSHSARETYLTCPRKYFLHYFLKLRPIRPRSPLVFGSAIDEGLNCLLETRDIERASMAFGEKWFSYRDKDVAYSKSDHDEFLLDNTDNKHRDKKGFCPALYEGKIIDFMKACA